MVESVRALRAALWSWLPLLCACEAAGAARSLSDAAGTPGTIAGAGSVAVTPASSPLPPSMASAMGGAGTSATGAGGAPGSTAGAAGIAEPIGGAPPAPVPVADPSAELFDPEVVVRFDLELDAQAVAALERVSGPDDPLQDTYVRGSLRHAGETLAEVGVRLKGEGSFRNLDRKAAFKLKLDEFVPDQKLRGLTRITLNNLVEDPSFLAERLAYEVFRAAGLPAPRCNSALVYVNGEPYGLYAHVESEDKTFLARWFGSNDGNLYEEGQVDFVPGAESAFVLETNETANDRSDLIALIAAIEGASDATLLEDIGAQLDTAQFLRFTAAEAAVNQWDMYAYTVFWPNNFRIYRDPASARFVFIPWGMDMSMKPYRDSGKPHIALFEVARQYDRARGPISGGALFQRCLASPACVQAYRDAAEAIIEVYEAQGLEARAERYYGQIREHVLSDPRSEYDRDEFESAYQALLSTIRERPDAMRADLAE